MQFHNLTAGEKNRFFYTATQNDKNGLKGKTGAGLLYFV